MARAKTARKSDTPVNPPPETVNPPANASTVEKPEKYVPSLGAQVTLPEIAASLSLPAGFTSEFKDGMYNLKFNYEKDPSLKDKLHGSIARVKTPPIERGKLIDLSVESLLNKYSGRVSAWGTQAQRSEEFEGNPRPCILLIECRVNNKPGDLKIQQYLIWIDEYTYVITFSYPAPKEGEKGAYFPVFDESVMSFSVMR